MPRPPANPSLLLASTSPFRKGLLAAVGLAFEAEAPGVDESVTSGLSPRALARSLALQKAEAVARRHPGALVIGSDQTCDFEGELLRKPGSRREARHQLSLLAGCTHRLHTAVAVVRREPRTAQQAVETVTLTMRPLARRDIEAYLDTGEWEGCAGAYRIEGQGLRLFERVRGDYHAIVGLPMLRLLAMLREAGLVMRP